MTTQRYRERGVSPQKEDVHAALGKSDRGLFPSAFCKIVPDTLTGSEDHCLVMHADGAGTKSSLAYLAYRESGDPSVFRGVVQDAVVMNLDDMLCVGALGPYMVSNTVGRNARRVPGEVLREIIGGFEEQAALFAQWGIHLELTGGETADVGDLVRTVILDSTFTARLERARVVANDAVQPGDIIIGLGSQGQTTYETSYNSGMGSNGLTSARHDLLHKDYASRYPESCDPEMPEELQYSGPFHLEDPLPGAEHISVGKALLSPTRTYAPVLKALLEEAPDKVRALVHCTGGGQTKCLRAGHGIRYVKDHLFDPPPIFQTIREVSGADWNELYQVFNMGHRMEIIGDPALLPLVEAIGAQLQLEVRQVGFCERHTVDNQNEVVLHTPGGVESYQGKE